MYEWKWFVGSYVNLLTLFACFLGTIQIISMSNISHYTCNCMKCNININLNRKYEYHQDELQRDLQNFQLNKKLHEGFVKTPAMNR